jgi:tetratricopeptide (TPR) repeat protein
VSSEARSQIVQEAIRLNGLAIQLYNEDKLSDAARAAQASVALLETRLGAGQLALASPLLILGAIYRAQRAHDAAESTFARSLEIVEQARGPMHLEIAAVLGHLGELYKSQGAYAKAEPVLVRALDIREQALGATHLDVADSLAALGEVYCGGAAYERAQQLFARALAIREAALGATHPDTAHSLVKLSLAHQEQGQHELAEPLLVRALAIFESTPSATYADVAKCLNNLAMMYKEQGAHENARPLLVRALELHERALGPTDPLVAVSLHNLASSYTQDRASEATALYERAIAIQEAALPPMHPHLAMSLTSLASHHRRLQAYERAEPLYLRAIEILERTLGRMHPELARSLGALATFYWEWGNVDRAEALSMRALEIAERALGPTHPLVATRLHELAALHMSRGEHASALAAFARAAAITEDRLQRELVGLPARRKRALLGSVRGETDGIISLHADAMPASPEALELALATVVRRKHRAVDSLTENQMNRLVRARPELRDTAQQLVKANAQASSWLRKAFLPDDARSYFVELESLRTRIDELEAKLNAAGAELRAPPEAITVPAIRAALPHGAALVELVRYHRFAPSAKEWHEARYAAYVLPWQGPPRWAALGPAAAIDAAIDTMLVEMRSHRDQPVADALRRLHALVFEPIRGCVTGMSHLIVSPDDKLNLVPFEALEDSAGHYVLESWLVSYLGSGRDLLRLRDRPAPRSIATIVAAPDYGAPRSTARGRAFHPLDGARREATELPAYLSRVRTLTGTQATKAALAATIGPAILHIATHGFFDRAGLTMDGSEAERGPARLASATAASTARPRAPRHVTALAAESSTFIPLPPEYEFVADPLERAGLALAGANDTSDGIVTARELANYDWQGTQLVVLSACDTGLGSVRAGEGVNGMRRALMLAGTETQVVSLWNVSDSSTAELMREFYGEMAHGAARGEALRRAKLRLLGRARFAHPYYWAAFILAGGWTPLASDVLRPIAHREARAGSAAASASPRVTWAGHYPTSAPLAASAARPQHGAPESLAPETRERPQLPAELELSIVLLITSEQLGDRVDTDELVDHIAPAQEEIVGVYARGEIRPAPMALFVAIKPGRRVKVWVEGIDCQLAAEDLALIERRTSAWRAPAVSGPVTFAYAFRRKDQPVAGAPRLPRAWAEAARKAGKTLALPDELVAAVWPD